MARKGHRIRRRSSRPRKQKVKVPLPRLRTFEVVWSAMRHKKDLPYLRLDVRVTVRARDATDAFDASRIVMLDTLPEPWIHFLITAPRKKGGMRIWDYPPSASEIPPREMSRYVEVFRYEGLEASEDVSPLASGVPYRRFRVGTRRPRRTGRRT